MRSRVLAVLLPVALSGCSADKLASSLPAAGAPVSYVGVGAGVLAAAAVGPELRALEDELDDLGGRRSPVPVRLSRDEEALRLGFGAVESFAEGSAELRAGALATYAGLARTLAMRPGTVAHIRVLGAAAGMPEGGASLPARRAASLEAYLVARGVPGARVRAQGAAGADAIEVLIKPIISGREAEAWVPPS